MFSHFHGSLRRNVLISKYQHSLVSIFAIIIYIYFCITRYSLIMNHLNSMILGYCICNDISLEQSNIASRDQSLSYLGICKWTRLKDIVNKFDSHKENCRLKRKPFINQFEPVNITKTMLPKFTKVYSLHSKKKPHHKKEWR